MKAEPIYAAAVLGAGIALWFLFGALAWPMRLLTILLLVVLPSALASQARLSVDQLAHVPRLSIYLTSSMAIWALAVLAVLASVASGFSFQLPGLVWLSPLPLVIWTLGILLLALLILMLARLVPMAETRILEYLIPRTAEEKLGFVGVSLSAGICEELIFRSFLISALTLAFGSPWTAAVLASAAFSLFHSYQGSLGMGRTALLGLVLSAPFVIAGSIIPSMIAHAVLNAIAGLWLADRLLEL